MLPGRRRPGSGGIAALLTLVQELAPELERGAAAGGAAVLGVTRLGGAFGLDGAADTVLGQRLSAAFSKRWRSSGRRSASGRSTSRRLPTPSSRRSNSPPSCTRPTAWSRSVTATGSGQRWRSPLHRSATSPTASRSIATGSSSITGGARGITAEAALELARRHRPTLVLVGRTPLADEPPETAGISDAAELRRTLIAERRRDGAELAPALVEADLRRSARCARGRREPCGPACGGCPGRVPPLRRRRRGRVRRADR